MTAKLNQVIAIEKGVKSQAYSTLTELNKALQKPDLFNGFQKTYQPVDEGGEMLPAENKRVQFTVPDVLKRAQIVLEDLMLVTERKDRTNCEAVADIVATGELIAEQVPVTYLLFLEKQLTDLRTLIGNFPVLDFAEDWTRDQNSGLYKSNEIKTHRTKKTARPIVLYQATENHPAQTQLITEDVLAGHWTQVKQSGAMPKQHKDIMLERIDNLIRAVKEAREKANSIDEVPYTSVGANIFNYLLKD